MSEKLKAFEMVLDRAKRKSEGKASPIATCPKCKEPLIMTLKFRGKEFICVECRSLWGFVEPIPAEETPELMTRLKELRAKWEAEQHRKDE